MASGEENDVDNIVGTANASVRGLNMTRNQLLHPTKEFMVDFFHKYLVTVDEVLGSVVKLNSEGLLGDAMFSSGEDIILSLYSFVSNITKQIPIDFFNLGDVYQPANRSKTTVKLLLNFLLYMQNNECVAKGIVGEITSLLEEHDSVNAEIDATKNKISVMSSEIAQMEENYLKAKNEADVINKSTQELEKQKYLDEIEKTKTADELKNLDEILNWHEDYLTFLKNDVAVLKSHIVDSDDFVDLQGRKTKLEEKIAEMQRTAAENDRIIRSKKAESDHLENVMKLIDSDDSFLNVVEKLQELKMKTENEESLQVKHSEQLKKLNAGLSKETQKEKRLTAEMYSQNCKYDNVLAHVRDEKKFPVEKSEQLKEHCRNVIVKCMAEEADLMDQCEKSEKELQAIYEVENYTYNNLLQQENFLFTTFDAQLQQLINKFSK